MRSGIGSGIVRGCAATITVAAVFCAFGAVAASVWTPVNSSYKLVFDEEFNGTALDLTKWNPSWFGSTSTQVTQPVNPGSETAAYSPAQVTVSGGYLNLTTIANPITIGFTTYPYRTGHINTNPKGGGCALPVSRSTRALGTPST
jgi:hypothetical protein